MPYIRIETAGAVYSLNPWYHRTPAVLSTAAEGRRTGGGGIGNGPTPCRRSMELANAAGNRLYREGNVEEAAAAYTSAIEQSLVARRPGGDGAGGIDGAKCRSKYYANRRVSPRWLRVG